MKRLLTYILSLLLIINPVLALTEDEVNTTVITQQNSKATVIIKSLMSNDNGYTIATGTGVILDDGHVITALHVVQDSVDITIVFYNGDMVKAKLIKAMAKYDLALLELQGSYIPGEVHTYNGADLRQGQKVIIIGDPLDVGFSVSIGVISALKEDFHGPGEVVAHMIQTDAAINHGNSGGPVFNSDGDLIGIVSFMMTDKSGGPIGLGFVISYKSINKFLRS
jgi:serine protease Do